jgi:hypothetical protein
LPALARRTTKHRSRANISGIAGKFAGSNSR